MSDQPLATDAQVTEPVKGKTAIGINQLNNPTPMWATWLFRIVFILTTTATFILASDNSIPDAFKVKIGVYLKAFDLAVWTFGRFLGVSKDNL